MMPFRKKFRPRPYDPHRKDTRTAAQKAANARNFHIFKLRGLASFSCLLSRPRRDAMRRLIDEELAAMGAKTSAEHEAEIAAAWAAHEQEKT